MRAILCLSIILVFCIMVFGTEVKNIDKPLKGEWDLKMKLDWRINHAGKDIFTVIDGIATAKDGTVYVLDRKNFKVYILDKYGKFIKSFGQKGEGPGEFAKVRVIFLKEDYLIVVDDRNVHYFSPGGEYKRSVRNEYIKFSPVSFIDLDTFISATVFADPQGSEKKGKISQYDLKTKTEKVISYFKVFEKGSVKIGSPGDYQVFSFSVSSLTPQMVLYHHKNRLYSAMSDDYRVKVTDLSGKEIWSFSLKRSKTKVTDEFKEKFVIGFPFPEEAKKQARKNLPDFLNFIEAIFVDENGFIYIFEPIYKNKNSQRVDIFSREGIYFFKSEIRVESTYNLSGVQIDRGIMYIVSEDEAGEIYLAKYSIILPQ